MKLKFREMRKQMILFLLLIVYFTNSYSQELVNNRVKDQLNSDYEFIYGNSIEYSDIKSFLDNLNFEKTIDDISVEPTFKAILPFDLPNYNQIHEKLFMANAMLWKKNNVDDIVIWKTNKWDFLNHFAEPPVVSNIPDLNIYMMKNEYRAESFNISNSTQINKDIKIKITVNGELNPDYIKVQEVLWTGTIYPETDSTNIIDDPVPAALPIIEKSLDYYQIKILPGMTKQLWLTFNPKTDIITNSAKIELYENDNLINTIPLSIKIYPYTFPEKPTLHFGGFDYLDGKEWHGITDENYDLIKDYLNDFFITPWGHPHTLHDKGNFFSSGDYYREPLTDVTSQWFNQWENENNYYIYAAMVPGAYPIDGLSDTKFEVGSPEFKNAVKNWSIFLSDYLKTKNIEPKNVKLNIIDEPGVDSQGGDNQVPLLKHAEAIHESGTDFKVWGDLTLWTQKERLIENINRDMVEAFDVIVPLRYFFDNNEQEFRDFIMDQMNNHNNDSKILVWNGSSLGLKKSYDIKGEYTSAQMQRDRAEFYVGDFNGKKKTDLLAFYKYPSNNTKIQTWEGANDGINNMINVRGEYNKEMYLRDWGKYFTGDFNGDSITDLISFYQYPDGTTKILEWKGTENGLSKSWEIQGEYNNYYRDWGKYYIGDFNGDGKDDLLSLYKYPDGTTKIFEWDGTEFGLSQSWEIRGEYNNEMYCRDLAEYYTGDFNGDSITDLLAFYQYPDGSSKILEWDGTENGLSKSWKIQGEYNNYYRDWGKYFTGDFNGDSINDLISFYQYPDGSTKILEWDGTESGLSKSWKIRGEYNNEMYCRDLANYYTGDFNGDGKKDLLAFYKYPDGSSKILEWDGTENGLNKSWKTRGSFNQLDYDRESGKYYVGDFDGDGKDDLLSFYQYPEGSKELQIYGCSGWTKLLDPYLYYRMQPWLCWKYNATGSHFWSFTDNGININTTKATSSWNEYALSGSTFTPFFIDSTTVTGGKHMEAAREGVEDYEYFVMLKNKIEEGKANNIDPDILNSADLILTNGVSQTYDQCNDIISEKSYLWNEYYDRSGADILRRNILDNMVNIDNAIKDMNGGLKSKPYQKPTDINIEETLNNFTVYPNPTSDIFEITFLNNLSKNEDLIIYNALGRYLQKINVKKNQRKQIVNLSGYPAGVYIMKLKVNDTTIVKRIIKY